jgi:ParB family chromosome partitioning protein
MMNEQPPNLLDRLRERGDAQRILEILPKVPPVVAERLKAILLGRQPLPIAEAQTVVAGPDVKAAGVAAHLLGRAGAASAGPAVAAALERWWQEWDEKRREETRRGVRAATWAGPFADPLRSLIWAAGRLGVTADTLLRVVTTRTDLLFDRAVRREAVAALASGKPTRAVSNALEGQIAGDDPEIRAVAAETVAVGDPARTGEVAARVLSDQVAFNRVARRCDAGLDETLRTAASQVHYQGVAVPHLAARREVAALAAVANNRSLPEETRLGAVEGLAAAASENAEAELEQAGKSMENSEELRKAAWRGLRRSKRKRGNKPRAGSVSDGV